jgi:hypothetical protein
MLPPMRNVYDQRRDNLRSLIKTWGGPTSMAKKLGHTNGSYLAQLAGPSPSREVSEKVAREFEAKLGLPSGWLDAEHGEPRMVDDEALSTCVRAVAAALRDAGHRATPDQMADLTALAYEHVKLTGRVDEPFIKKLVRLTKS